MNATRTSVLDRLAADRLVVQDHMMRLLADGTPRDLYELARVYPSRPGKGLRAGICLASCRAFGGSTADALDIATSIELLHNAFLVIDDIQDESLRRRGEPTLHTMAGVSAAISAAGALTSLAIERALAGTRAHPALAQQILTELAHLLRRTHEGQWTELTWVRDGRVDVTEADYLAMIQDKTCWYTTIHPLRLGALIGSRGRADLDRLVTFGFYLGALFQICDDQANLLGEPGSYDKDVKCDLVEGKRTIPIIDLLARASAEDRSRVVDALATTRSDAAAVQQVWTLLRRYHSLDHAQEFADGVTALAAAAFTDALVEARPGPDRDLLGGLVDVVRTSITQPC